MSQLTAPVITAEVIDRVKIKISGLTVEHASAYQLRWGTLSNGGRVDTIQPDSEGSFLLDDCRARTTYFIAARALGDDEQYENSSWSTEISVVTGQIVDSSIAIPSIALGSATYTTVSITGLLLDRSYRYQISTSADTLADQPPKIVGASTGTTGDGVIGGLRPGTTYYVRFCSTAPRSRCSLWGETLSFSTLAPDVQRLVTNTNDSGEGSLYDAIWTSGIAHIKFDPSLDGAVIPLPASGNWSPGTKIVDASDLPHGIVIDMSANNINSLLGDNTHWVGVTFKNHNVTANNTYGFNKGYFSDCSFIDCTISSNHAMIYSAILCRCKIIACSGGASGSIVSTCRVADSIVEGGIGTILWICAASNVTVCNCNCKNALNNPRATNCTLYNNISNTASFACNGGNAYECDFVSNSLEMSSTPNNGQIISGNLYDCRVCHNTSNGNYDPAYSSTAGYCYDTIFIDNKGKLGNGVGAGRYYRCTVIEDDYTRYMIYGVGGYYTDCLLIGGTTHSAASFLNCTIDRLSISTVPTYNCLLGPKSSTPSTGDHNIIWAGDESPTSPVHYSKIFLDAPNGDYRLAINSPAIGAGDTQYTSDGDLDLAGNPRITNGNVSCGAYEFAAFELEPPTFSISIQTGGQINISYTIPDYSSGFCLQYADNQDFTDAHEVSSSATSFDLQGLSGDVWIRAKSVGISGQTLDSDWTEASHIYVDTTAPIVTVNQTPIEIEVGSNVDLLDGVTVVDDSSSTPILRYQVIGSDNRPIEVDGQTDNPTSGAIPKGNYLLKIIATDASGNEGVSDRGLVVLPPRLPTPTLTLRSVRGTTIVLAGLTNLFAAGWDLDHNGTVSAVTPDAAGYLVIGNLAQDVTHVFKARALGDFVQPEPPATMTGDHRDSDWSDVVTITLVPPLPIEMTLYKWTAAVDLSGDGRIGQNMMIRAKITDAETGDRLPPDIVADARFTAYRLTEGGLTPLDGFKDVTVPSDCFLDGDSAYNFRFIPDQSEAMMLTDPGRYVFVVSVKLASGNPFDIYSDVITVS